MSRGTTNRLVRHRAPSSPARSRPARPAASGTRLTVASPRVPGRPWRYVLPALAVMAAMFGVMAISLQPPASPGPVPEAPRRAESPPAVQAAILPAAPARLPEAAPLPAPPLSDAAPAVRDVAPASSPSGEAADHRAAPDATAATASGAAQTGAAAPAGIVTPGGATAAGSPGEDAATLPLPPRRFVTLYHAPADLSTRAATRPPGTPRQTRAVATSRLATSLVPVAPVASPAAAELRFAQQAVAADDLGRARLLLAQAETAIVFAPADGGSAPGAGTAARITEALAALDAGDRPAALASITRAIAEVSGTRP